MWKAHLLLFYLKGIILLLCSYQASLTAIAIGRSYILLKGMFPYFF